MITEFLIAGSVVALWNSRQKIDIYMKWKRITSSDSRFTNKLGKTIKIWHYKETYYGYDLVTELPYSYTFAEFQNDINIFTEALKLKDIELKAESNVITMRCIKNYNFVDFKPLKLPPNKLLIADGLVHPIIVDMNKFPHMLIGGDTGTGKSRIILMVLSNLIANNKNIDIYLLQVRKNDLGVFQKCSQVRVFAKNLEEVLQALQRIDAECRKREGLIDNSKGIYSIADYNKQAHFPMKYTYIVIEEFSFLNTSKGDSKEEKTLKNQCLKYIKTIVNIGRAVGIFLITALQKPTADSIPTDIKAQLTTRVSLKILDGPAAKVILGNENNTKLQERELIVRTLNEDKGYSYTINHDMVMDAIGDSIIEKPETVKEVKKETVKNNKIIPLSADRTAPQPVCTDTDDILRMLNDSNL